MIEEKYNLDYSRIKTKKPRETNFDRITESEEALAKWLEKLNVCVYSIKDQICPKFANPTHRDCQECIKEWLQKECEESSPHYDVIDTITYGEKAINNKEKGENEPCG